MFVFALFLWQATFDVGKIDINGLSRFKPDAVIATTKVAVGSKAGKPEFDAGCRRLLETGLFEGCSWKYVPSSPTGIQLLFDVKEAPAEQKARLTIPGVSEAELWDWLGKNEPLVQAKMPASDEAVHFYTAAIGRFLKKNVEPSVDTNLATRETTLVFRPKDLTKIDSVRFEGAQAIPAGTLEAKLNPLAKGSPFTEYDVKQLLDLNIRPMYEELGRLNVSFPSIKADGGAVTIRVDEGRVYNIGQVRSPGDSPAISLSAGQVANWRKVNEAVEEAAKKLRNQGYLEAKYAVKRELNEAAGTVDLAIDLTRGKQFTFGALKLDGLNVSQEPPIRALWSLKPGAPMNAGYVDDFIKAAFGKLGNEFSGVASQMDPRDGDVVDVAITFRRR